MGFPPVEDGQGANQTKDAPSPCRQVRLFDLPDIFDITLICPPPYRHVRPRLLTMLFPERSSLPLLGPGRIDSWLGQVKSATYQSDGDVN